MVSFQDLSKSGFACGIDIVYIPGLKKILKNEQAMKKFFHSEEITENTNEDVRIEHLAGVLAAKEAFFKALGVVPKFLEVRVGYESSGRPKLIVSPQWQKFNESDVSISHDKDYAVAVVVLL